MYNQNLLFDDLITTAPATEAIKYAGSKLKILPHILSLARETPARSVFDGFSGSTRVSQAFARCGYQVAANDCADWSYVLGSCYLKNRQPRAHYQALINHLNAVPPADGWFTEHYGGEVFPHARDNAIQPDGSKKPWQIKNTRKLDAIRDEIERLNLDGQTKAVALVSLMLALDKVDSALGHYVSYLKQWSPRSFNDLKLEVPALWINERDNTVTQSDVFARLPGLACDLAYYDPPYGSNNEKMPPSRVRYASYYHIWASVIRHDKPAVAGRAMRRADASDKVAASVFEEFRKSRSGRYAALEAIERLIQQTPCARIILSYSSGGRATAAELNEVIRDNARLIKAVEIDYQKHVMAGMKWSNEWVREAEEPNREFLFLIEGGGNS